MNVYVRYSVFVLFCVQEALGLADPPSKELKKWAKD
jgi:hypothetical protein